MDYAKLNELLRNLDSLRNGKPVETHKEEYSSSWYEVYHIEDDIYVKIHLYEDSYGNDEAITGLEFVTPTKVTVTNFEPIKK